MYRKTSVNYESRENCFAKCEHVKSRLVYGDPSNIPNPWITVVIPTYRRVHLLRQALDSVLSQWVTDFLWDIIVVDNEPDDGLENDTERLIRSYQSKRIMYYRNSENIWVGDNFNRCFLLARGEWVMMLHDDDFLIHNTVRKMGQWIRAFDTGEKPLGAIAASYIQVEYDPVRDKIKEDVLSMNYNWCMQPNNYMLYKLTHNNVKFFSHIGGAAPTNGSTFRRQAVIDIGGFNEKYGISGDLILFYNLENEYNVYQSSVPLGFYRWGMNSMMEKESIRKVVRDNFDYREYVYQKNPYNRLIGKLFRNCHYKRFTNEAIAERVKVSGEPIMLSDFDDIYAGRPNPLWYFFYTSVILRIYGKYKYLQEKRSAKKAIGKMGTI